MNNIKAQMDNYFAGLNLALIRRQIKNYCRLVIALDESTLTDIAESIANELNVSYDETRHSVIIGFLNDYMNKEIGERTLFHCIIGACDKYSEDLPELVLEISHRVLESVYSFDEDEHVCDCSSCGNMDCPHRGKDVVASYDLTKVMKGILAGETEIMDGDVKVPLEVVLSTAKFMDSTNLTDDELVWAVNSGVFEGKIVETTRDEEEVEEESEEVKDESKELDVEAIKEAMAKTDELVPGAREKMLEASKVLKNMGLDVEAMITDMLMVQIESTGAPLNREEVAKIVKTVMDESN